MKINRLKTTLVVGTLLVSAGLGGCQEQPQNEAQLRMREDSIRFEAYTRGFRDGIYATVKHEMPEKKKIELAPILSEMRPLETR